jgi:glycosyltransferase involved in cell wall biosynthesis/ubiquinone/menaquinone biosynthesis C-methylase UbiE
LFVIFSRKPEYIKGEARYLSLRKPLSFEIGAPFFAERNMNHTLEEGETLFAAGKIDEAQQCFLSIVENDPYNKEAYNNLGVISFNNNDVTSACDYLTASLQIDPLYKDAIINLYQVLKSVDQVNLTIPFLERLKNILPADEVITELLKEACSPVRSKIKIGFFCLPGLESFLVDIIDGLRNQYEIQRCYTNDTATVESIVQWADIVWLEWANELAIALTNNSALLRDKRVICRLHSYEAFAGYVQKINWEVIDDLLFVAGHIKDVVLKQVPDLRHKVHHIHVVPNGINVDKFAFKERSKGWNLAFLGNVNYKKGPMLLLHALRALVDVDNRYRLFVGGNFQDGRYALYFEQMAQEMKLERNIQLDGYIQDIQAWLDDKQYIVCTSVLEGHPVGIMEAMACGLKPAIHNFVGARSLYPPEYIWNTIPEFVALITQEKVDSQSYRNFITQNFSLENQLTQLQKLTDRPIKKKEIFPPHDQNDAQPKPSPTPPHSPSINGKVDKALSKTVLPPGDGKGSSPGVSVAFRESLSRAIDWLKHNTLPGQGIIVSGRKKIPYPEITGYLIPTLLEAGERDLALNFARWLMSVQRPDGSFTGPGVDISFAFDTGQILRGLVVAMDYLPGLEKPIRRACDWLIANSSSEGRLPVPANQNAWDMGRRGTISEGVHLYVLPPIVKAGERLNEPYYLNFVQKSLNYYIRNMELNNFKLPNMLTHLFVYIQEALFDLGVYELAAEGMRNLAAFQWENGGVPAYSDVAWVCSPGLAQAAVVWCKLGEKERADLALSFLKSLQNPSGGFFGSYGVDADYFPQEEISWAVKFYLDGLILSNTKKNHTTTAKASSINTNLDAQAWHSALAGAGSPESIAERLQRGQILPWVQTLLEQTAPGQTLLELGSGTGELSAALALQGRKVVLLDFSPECLDFSRKLFNVLGQQARFSLADVLKGLPFLDRTFDCVWSSGLLEHFEESDLHRIMRESVRVSRGKVMTLVPNAGSIPYRVGKWFQEQAGTWKWGKEDPKLTLKPYFEAAGLTHVREFSIAHQHALRFLSAPGLEQVSNTMESWFRSLEPEELDHLNQGYLLVTAGSVPARKRLAVVPNDPLQAYQDAGYPDLTHYFNPGKFFDEVYCLSPIEPEEKTLYGMNVIPIQADQFTHRLIQLNIDMVRAYDLRAGHFAAANMPKEIPLIISVHDTNPQRVPAEMPMASRYLAISQAVKDFLVARGVPPKNIDLFANRVDLDVFHPLNDPELRHNFRARYPGRFRILHVGRRVEQKNLDTLIKALAILGLEYTAIFVGKGDTAPYKKLAAEQNVFERCHFVESVPNAELAQYYSFCNCMCTPSRWEGFGIVFIEALACQAVVVTSNLAPMNEYIKDQENGILVDQYENAGNLAQAISRACTDLSLRRKIKSRARESAEKFSKQKIDQMEVEIYRKFLESSGNPQGAVRPARQPHVSKISIVTLSNEIKKEWNKIADSSNDAWLYHTFEWQELLTKAWKACVFSFALVQGEEMVAIFPLVVMPGSGLLDSTFGPAGMAFANHIEPGRRRELFSLALEHAGEIMTSHTIGALRISLSPLAHSNEENFNSLLVPHGFKDASTHTFILKLDREIEDVWQGFTKTMRYDIRKALEKGFEITPATCLADMQEYYKLHVQTYTRTGVRPHPYEYFEAIWNYFGERGLARIFLARQGGRTVAADNIAVFKNRALYWTNASDTDYLESGVNKILQWEAIQWAKKSGIERYEVGEAFPDAGKDSKAAGLTFFKKSFGGDRHRFYKGLWKPGMS